MKPTTFWHGVLFIVGLWLLSYALIDVTDTTPKQRRMAISSVVPRSSPPASLSGGGREVASAPPTPVVPAKVWPADWTPTSTVSINDSNHSAKGIMSFTLNPGDDLQVEFGPLWVCKVPDQMRELEIAVNDGNGFEKLQDYWTRVSPTQDAGKNSWWWTSRLLRFRIRPGLRGNLGLQLDVSRMVYEEMKPGPFPPPQQFGDVTISVEDVKRTEQGRAVFTVVFHNTSSSHTIGAAIHSEVITPRASLVSSDGKEYVLVGFDGIGMMSLNPSSLTQLDPGETDRATATWTWWKPGAVSSFRLQMEIVLDSNYSRSAVASFQQNGYNLPPTCRVHNFITDIPITTVRY